MHYEIRPPGPVRPCLLALETARAAAVDVAQRTDTGRAWCTSALLFGDCGVPGPEGVRLPPPATVTYGNKSKVTGSGLVDGRASLTSFGSLDAAVACGSDRERWAARLRIGLERFAFANLTPEQANASLGAAFCAAQDRQVITACEIDRRPRRQNIAINCSSHPRRLALVACYTTVLHRGESHGR
jgi:hypothetical protein